MMMQISFRSAFMVSEPWTLKNTYGQNSHDKVLTSRWLHTYDIWSIQRQSVLHEISQQGQQLTPNYNAQAEW